MSGWHHHLIAFNISTPMAAEIPQIFPVSYIYIYHSIGYTLEYLGTGTLPSKLSFSGRKKLKSLSQQWSVKSFSLKGWRSWILLQGSSCSPKRPPLGDLQRSDYTTRPSFKNLLVSIIPPTPPPQKKKRHPKTAFRKTDSPTRLHIISCIIIPCHSYHENPPKTIKNEGFGHPRTKLFIINTSKDVGFLGAHGIGYL